MPSENEKFVAGGQRCPPAELPAMNEGTDARTGTRGQGCRATWPAWLVLIRLERDRSVRVKGIAPSGRPLDLG